MHIKYLIWLFCVLGVACLPGGPHDGLSGRQQHPPPGGPQDGLSGWSHNQQTGGPQDGLPVAYDDDIYSPQLQTEDLNGLSVASDDDMSDETLSSSDSDHGAEGMDEDDNLPDHRFEKR